MTKIERTQVKELAAGMGPWESKRVDCPFCSKGDNSLSITRTPVLILYNCYHASCGAHGGIGGVKVQSFRLETLKEFTPRPYTGVILPIDQRAFEGVLDLYGITPQVIEQQGIGYNPTIDRVIFPLFTYGGYVWGHLAKAVEQGIKPKTLLYKANDVPTLHFPIQSITSDRLVLVEDVVSAIRVVGIGDPCAALLGTHLSEEIVLYIKSLGFNRIAMMLDPDATNKSIAYAKKFGGLLNFEVIPLSKEIGDPKDHIDKELYALLHKEEIDGMV